MDGDGNVIGRGRGDLWRGWRHGGPEAAEAWGRRCREGDRWRGAAAAAAAAAMATSSWSGQRVKAVAAAARMRAAAAAMVVGLLPQPSLSCHSSGRGLLSFLK